MSIIGIDKEKCSNCKLCIRECGRGYFYLDENRDVGFKEGLNTAGGSK